MLCLNLRRENNRTKETRQKQKEGWGLISDICQASVRSWVQSPPPEKHTHWLVQECISQEPGTDQAGIEIARAM